MAPAEHSFRNGRAAVAARGLPARRRTNFSPLDIARIAATIPTCAKPAAITACKLQSAASPICRRKGARNGEPPQAKARADRVGGAARAGLLYDRGILRTAPD